MIHSILVGFSCLQIYKLLHSPDRFATVQIDMNQNSLHIKE